VCCRPDKPRNEKWRDCTRTSPNSARGDHNPHETMDPLSALSIATGIVTFIDFGAKLVTLYVEIQKSDDGRPAALSALETESRELSGHSSHAISNIAALKERYPRQAELLTRLAAQCAQAEEDLRSLTDSLTMKAASQHGLRARGALALVAIRSRLKQGDIDVLQDRLRSIREQLMMTVIMCIAYVPSHASLPVGSVLIAIFLRDDATESRRRLAGLDSGVGEALDMLRPIKTAIADLQPEFASASRTQPLETSPKRARMASGLWTSITTAEGLDTPYPQPSPTKMETPPDEVETWIRSKILQTLKFEDIGARESQIQTPFPDTFKWLLEDQPPNKGTGDAIAPPPTKFKEWLESQANEDPFWVTGIPASGKSTLMKFTATNPNVRQHLEAWSGEVPLLMCSVYFWNLGSSSQKSQTGLLSTILYQLLSQRPDLCRHATLTRYRYFQLAGPDAPHPPPWTLEELRSGLSRFVSGIHGTGRLALFVDGLDEYDGDLDTLISFLKRLHSDHKVKLCVSSRPWNAFKDAFRTYPSLRMEHFTKPDITKYVRTRIGASPAFQELRGPFATDVERLEAQIIEKANGVFLWVVLVVQKIIDTARDNNDLGEIWKVSAACRPGSRNSTPRCVSGSTRHTARRHPGYISSCFAGMKPSIASLRVSVSGPP